MDGGLAESLVIVLQELALVSDSIGTNGRKEEESLSFNEKISPLFLVRPYHPHVSFP